eukprot:2396330-Rhodomonas_salina.2
MCGARHIHHARPLFPSDDAVGVHIKFPERPLCMLVVLVGRFSCRQLWHFACIRIRAKISSFVQLIAAQHILDDHTRCQYPDAAWQARRLAGSLPEPPASILISRSEELFLITPCSMLALYTAWQAHRETAERTSSSRNSSRLLSSSCPSSLSSSSRSRSSPSGRILSSPSSASINSSTLSPSSFAKMTAEDRTQTETRNNHPVAILLPRIVTEKSRAETVHLPGSQGCFARSVTAAFTENPAVFVHGGKFEVVREVT